MCVTLFGPTRKDNRRCARHAGQRRATLLANNVVEDGRAIPLLVWSERGHAVAPEQLEIEIRIARVKIWIFL